MSARSNLIQQSKRLAENADYETPETLGYQILVLSNSLPKTASVELKARAETFSQSPNSISPVMLARTIRDLIAAL